MSLSRLEVIFGKLEGAEGKFSRDVTGYLGIEAGIYSKWRLEVSWQHVQGTEERYRRLESGDADISFVVGRAALKHFLDSGTTRLIGSSLNSCPYHLIGSPTIRELKDLKEKSLACRVDPARTAPLAEVFAQKTGSKSGGEVTLKLLAGDQDAYDMLVGGQVQAALVPRQYGFLAEEKGFKGVNEWPDIVDDPLPIAIETTERIFRGREKNLSAFLNAHREAIRYLKAHRPETVFMLGEKFGHSPALAGKTFDDYLILLDDRLTIDFKYLEKLLAQVAPDRPGGARKLASEWIVPGALRG